MSVIQTQMSSGRRPIIVRKNNNVSYYDLNFEHINRNLPLWKAFFELLTNAYDCVNGSKSHVEIETVRSDKVIIKDRGPGIESKHLRLAESQHNSKQTGRFGIGLKDAISIIMNNGGNIKIQSRYLNVESIVLRPKENHQEHTYHAKKITPNSSLIGTEIIVNVVGASAAFEMAKDHLIYFYQQDPIFTCQKGEIYSVNDRYRQFYRGVLSCEGAKSLFSYNLYQTDAIDKLIHRDRELLSSKALNMHISKILMCVPDQHPIMDQLIEVFEKTYRQDPKLYIEFSQIAFRKKIEKIISTRDRSSRVIQINSELSATLVEATSKELDRLKVLKDCCNNYSYSFTLVGEFREYPDLESWVDMNDIYLTTSVLGLDNGSLAKKIGNIFTEIAQENEDFVEVYPIRDMIVDIALAI